MTDITRVPLALRQHKGWLVWKLLPSDKLGGKPRKVPYCIDGMPRQGVQGSAEDRMRLATFDDACRVLAGGGWAGLGFAMLPDWGLVGLDFDHCLDDAGNVLPGMWEGIWPVIAGTYAEISPSGSGLRAFVVGKSEDHKAPAAGGDFGFETFCAKGFLTITGRVLDACEMLDHDTGLAVANGALSRICAARFGGGVARSAGPTRAPAEDWPRVRSALEYIALGMWEWPAGEELGRSRWLSAVVFGTHFASGGSDEGRALAWAASAELPGFDAAAEADFEKAWANADSERGGAKASGDSVAHLARLLGWSDPRYALSVDTFDVVVSDADKGPGAPLDPPPFTRTANGVHILPTVTNAVLAVRRPDLTGWRVGHDEFKDEIMIAEGGSPGDDGWRAMHDADLVGLRMSIEAMAFKTVPKDLIRDAVVKVCEENRFDSAVMWLERVARGWDRRSRVDTFLIDYFGATDDPAGYTRACGRYLWTAFAGRVLDPGCQVDMIVTLTGGQGLRKSSAIGAMVPGHEFMIEVDFSKNEEDTARRMRGALVGEIAELRGLHTKDLDAIKKFITRRHENWIPKYKEFSTTFPRRLVFVGSVNPSSAGFLGDETGERRWLPVPVDRADVEGIAEAREQLWAEGAAMWRAGGVAWADAERLAAPMHEEFGMTDMWEDPIGAWLDGADGLVEEVSENQTESRGAAAQGVQLSEIAAGALGIAIKDMTMMTQRRIGAIIRKLGYTRHKITIQGVRVWRWVHPSIVARLGAPVEEN
jgi:hypothetical protein